MQQLLSLRALEKRGEFLVQWPIGIRPADEWVSHAWSLRRLWSSSLAFHLVAQVLHGILGGRGEWLCEGEVDMLVGEVGYVAFLCRRRVDVIARHADRW